MYTMRPQDFAYHRPGTLDEALELLAGDDDARPLAGGHSLIPVMKLRLAAPSALVDLARVPGLDTIDRDDGTLRIGAMVTYEQLGTSDVAHAACPIVAETAAFVGDPQIRNCGTIGGSLAHADPGGDYPTVVKALRGTITARTKGGERQIDADDLLAGPFTTTLRAGELVTSISVPVLGPGSAGVYMKHRHPASGYAVAGVAVVLTLEGGRCTKARVTVGGAQGTPVNADAAAEALVGESGGAEAIAAAAARVPDAIESPLDDTYASGEYRTHLATVLAKRALTKAFERARTGGSA